MNKDKITKDTSLRGFTFENGLICLGAKTLASVNSVFISDDQFRANGTLIADAFNTFNKTGLTPSELNQELETGANQYAKAVADMEVLREENHNLKRRIFQLENPLNQPTP